MPCLTSTGGAHADAVSSISSPERMPLTAEVTNRLAVNTIAARSKVCRAVSGRVQARGPVSLAAGTVTASRAQGGAVPTWATACSARSRTAWMCRSWN